MRRNKQKSDFTHYIVFLKSVIEKVKKVNTICNIRPIVTVILKCNFGFMLDGFAKY